MAESKGGRGGDSFLNTEKLIAWIVREKMLVNIRVQLNFYFTWFWGSD